MIHAIDEHLDHRVRAHLAVHGDITSVTWTGRGSVAVRFATPLSNVTAADTRFTPLLVNWSSTFRAEDGAVHLNIPAVWRNHREGEANTMPMYLSLSEPQQNAVRTIHGGDQFANIPQGTLKALVAGGWVVGTKEGGRILPPLVLSPAGETLIFEYDVMRLQKAQDFKSLVWEPVQYLKWNSTDQGSTFEWVDAVVTSVGKEMINLRYEDDTTGTRRPGSLRKKPDQKPIREMLGVFYDTDDQIHIRRRPFGSSYCGRDMVGLSHAGVPTCPECIRHWQNDMNAVAEYVEKKPAEPVYLDIGGAVLRVHDWVKTMVDHPYPIPAGSHGAIVGFKNGLAVVAFADRVANDDFAHFPEYNPIKLERIDTPEPPNDPVDYEAYNGGLADAALTALEQADIEQAKKADPYAWATLEKRSVVDALLEEKRVYPLVLKASTTADVWIIEDEWRVKTMLRTLAKLGVDVVGEVEQDWIGDTPYCTALFRVPAGYAPKGEPEILRPYPSKRQTMPEPDWETETVYVQYQRQQAAVGFPKSTLRVIQINGDEWNAFEMDAQLLRSYAPLCRYDWVAINARGEKWDRLIIPATMLDEVVSLANEGGRPVALISIAHDEADFAQPRREVTEIHEPGQPVQYLDREEPPTETPVDVVITAATFEQFPTVSLWLAGALPLAFEQYVATLDRCFTLVSQRQEELAAHILYDAFAVEYTVLADRVGHDPEADALFHQLTTGSTHQVRETLAALGRLAETELELFSHDEARNYRYIVGQPKGQITPSEYVNEGYAARVLGDEVVVRYNGQPVAVVTKALAQPGFYVLTPEQGEQVIVGNLPVLMVSPVDDAPAPVEWEDEPPTTTTPPPKLEMTPERMAGKIRLHIHGGLRLGRVESVTHESDPGWSYMVKFTHPISKPIMDALRAEYDVEPITNFAVVVTTKTAAPLGDVFEQAGAVVEPLPDLPDAPEPTVELLDETAEQELLAALASEYPDLHAVSDGPTQFVINVIAKMRALEAARQY